MPRQRTDHDKPVLLVENEVNAQQIFRIVSYLQMLVERRFALFALRVGKIHDLVLRRRELNGHIADRGDLERTAVLARAAVESVGGDRLTAGIDAKGGEVAVSGWIEGSGVAATDLARAMGAAGFKHIVYTDIARDGMQTGLDVQAYVQMAEAFGHPVIASGGVASVADIERLAPVAASIEGVITGRAVYEGTLTVEEGVAACAAATKE